MSVTADVRSLEVGHAVLSGRCPGGPRDERRSDAQPVWHSDLLPVPGGCSRVVPAVVAEG